MEEINATFLQLLHARLLEQRVAQDRPATQLNARTSMQQRALPWSQKIMEEINATHVFIFAAPTFVHVFFEVRALCCFVGVCLFG